MRATPKRDVLSRTALLGAAVSLILAGGAGLATPAQAATPNPSVDYLFDGTLTDSAAGSTLTVTPTCPAPVPSTTNNQCIFTSAFGSDSNGPYWNWTAPGRNDSRRGGGFQVVTNSPLTSTYTIALKFSYSITNLSSYSYLKIIDYQNKTSDRGFYFRNGKLQSYPGNTGATVYATNEVLDLVATRDGATNEFKVYSRSAGGALQLQYTYSDPSGDLVPTNSGSGSILGFFFDDNSTSTEATDGGNVYRLRTWNGVALTQAEIEAATAPASASASTDGPPPWLQSYGRTSGDSCISGWDPSWAEWAQERTGGWVCNRTVFWNGSAWSQNPATGWGPWDPSRSTSWDGR